MSTLPPFRRRFFGADERFTVMGEGALGGKATGLELIRRRILDRLDPAEAPGITVDVPTLTVLSTELFDRFMDENDLWPVALEGLPDDRLALAFQQAELPAAFVGDLRALADLVHQPLALRSSSLLEDALHHPFAGVYATKMVPGGQAGAADRFRQLVEGVKLIWASAFFAAARRYRERVGLGPRDEKMAVVVQEIVGRRHGDRFYPALSGVARSHNHYPFGHARPEDGVVNLALGLGRQIVDGGLTWSYSPAWPASPAPFKTLNDLLKNTQTGFWAVNMGRPPVHDPLRETEYLLHDELETAEEDGVLAPLASTYDPQSGRLRPGLTAAGPRVLDFAPVLRHGALPLNAALLRLLALSREALEGEVELEFALTLDPAVRGRARLGVLQLRPMLVSEERVDIPADLRERPELLLAADGALGNGVETEIRDVVYLKPAAFDTRHTRSMAAALEAVNRRLQEAGRPYLLIGFGRWGSTDEWLGVPVDWSQISGARVIVEATLPELRTDMSQGSHFFHNLISFQVKYLSVPHDARPPIDWAWLDARPAEEESTFVRWIRTAHPLEVRVDGIGGHAVVMRNARDA